MQTCIRGHCGVTSRHCDVIDSDYVLRNYSVSQSIMNLFLYPKQLNDMQQ